MIRPTIDFSGSSRLTARSYASDLVSRVNKPETNDVLRQVANGQQVDAYALAAALLDAQRHVATRFGQSMQRRREGEKAAHLGYIAHAVLANHADGLPVYEGGQRSAKIEELKREVEHAGSVNQSLTRDLTEARETVRLLAAQVEEAKAALESEQAKHASTIDNLLETDKAWTEALAGLTQIRKVHSYAFGLLSDQDQAQVKGYEDGINA